MIRLDESGLLIGDLDHLILPLIEIDNFESKISNSKAIVIAFYVFEQEPARDLERFIEKGSISILDTETSPAPTEDGYYVVFVELLRDKNFPEFLVEIIESVENLTNITNWQFKTLNYDRIYDLTEENLRQYVNLDPAMVPKSKNDVKDELDTKLKNEKKKSKKEPTEEPKDKVAESVSNILCNGLMESIEIIDDYIKISGYKADLRYKIINVSESEPSVPIIGLEIGNPMINESAKLSHVLGPSYIVEAIDNGLLISSEQGFLILEPITD